MVLSSSWYLLKSSMTGLLVAMIVFALGRKAGSSGIVFFAGRPFGGLDYVTYLCCARSNNLYLYGF